MPKDQSEKSLTNLFSPWLDPGPNALDFYKDALIVFDTSSLLSLYRIATTARVEVLSALKSVSERIWIPHQVGLEFSRQRSKIILDRQREFKEIREAVRHATQKAAEEIERTAARLVALRDRHLSVRQWNPSEHGLDRDSILKRLDGLMNPASTELEALESEFDLAHEEILRFDPVLARVDALFKGKVGPPFDAGQLRLIRDDAINFRFPNEIPPGYRDRKATDLRSIGDLILWLQIVEEVGNRSGVERMLFVTNDTKEDWWTQNSKGEPLHIRQELRQELMERTGADAMAARLPDFLADARIHLLPKPSKVTDRTIQELRILGNNRSDGTEDLDLRYLSMNEFRDEFKLLFEAMGHSVSRVPGTTDDYKSVLMLDTQFPHRKALLEVRRQHDVLKPSAVYQMGELISAERYPRGMIACTAPISADAALVAEEQGIDIIGPMQIVALFERHRNLKVIVNGMELN